MVEPKWDFQGGEDLEAAIDRYKTEAIPEFLDLIVKEAQTDDFQVRYTPLPSALVSISHMFSSYQVKHILSVYAKKFFWTYFNEECKKTKKMTE